MKGFEMNEEKKIAGAILDAWKMREESYTCIDDPCGEYRKDMESCLIETCKQRGLSTNLWALLNLAIWHSDIQLWAKHIFAGKDIIFDTPCCHSPSKEKCDQCQEIGIANPLNT